MVSACNGRVCLLMGGLVHGSPWASAYMLAACILAGLFPDRLGYLRLSQQMRFRATRSVPLGPFEEFNRGA